VFAKFRQLQLSQLPSVLTYTSPNLSRKAAPKDREGPKARLHGPKARNWRRRRHPSGGARRRKPSCDFHDIKKKLILVFM